MLIKIEEISLPIRKVHSLGRGKALSKVGLLTKRPEAPRQIATHVIRRVEYFILLPSIF